MAISLRLPFFGARTQESEQVSVISPQPDISASQTKQAYTVQHLERFAPEMVGEGRLGKTIKVEALPTLRLVEKEWSRRNGHFVLQPGEQYVNDDWDDTSRAWETLAK